MSVVEYARIYVRQKINVPVLIKNKLIFFKNSNDLQLVMSFNLNIGFQNEFQINSNEF